MEASILPKVTANLRTVPVSPVTKWKHLSDLEFGDPNYGTPAWVDKLHGGKVFSQAVLHGWWFGPTGAPSEFRTCFSWVLNREVKGKGWCSSAHVFYAAVGNNALARASKWHIVKHATCSEHSSPGGRREIKLVTKPEVLAGRMLAPESTLEGISCNY